MELRKLSAFYDIPEPSRSYARRDIEESTDVKGVRAGDDEDWEGSDKMKYRSGKSRKQNNPEEVEEDSAGRRRSSGDRKRASGSIRSGSGDEDDYESRKEIRSKQIKKTQEERPEKKLSSGHQDREPESSRRSRDASGGKGHGVADEGERELSRKSSSKPSSHESSQSKSKGKMDISHEGEMEKMKDRDSRHSERKESSRDKGHGSREQERNQGRKWDESDSIRKREESNYVGVVDSRSGKASDVRHGNVKERIDLRNELTEIKSRAVDLKGDRAIKSSNDEEKRVDGERSKIRSRAEAQEEDTRPGSIIREERSGGPRDDKQRRLRDKPSMPIDNLDSVEKASTRGQEEKNERHRQQSDPSHGVHDSVESRERSVNNDEDGRARARDRSVREDKHSRRSCSPERSARRRPESDDAVDSDGERSNSLKAKEREKEGLYMDDRSKGRESSWSERNRDHESFRENWNRRHSGSNDKETIYAGDHEGSKDNWNRRHSSANDKEAAYAGDYEGSKDNWIRRHSSGNDKETPFGGDHEGSKDNWNRRHSSSNDKETTFSDYDFDRERNWEMQRRDRERIDNKFNGRPGYRKFNRNEGGKSSLYGAAKGNTDSIEIRPEFHDDGREEIESIFAGRKIETVQQPDFQSATRDEQWGQPYEDRTKMADAYGPGDDPDSGSPMLDQNSGRINVDMQGEKGRGQKSVVSSNRTASGPSSGNGSLPPFGNNQGPSSFGRGPPQGPKGNRLGRGGRGRLTGRDGQRISLPLPMMGPPFSPLGLPPGPMQALGPNMSPAPGPPIGLFIPPFPGPNIWPGARGGDMNMLPVPPGLSPVPPGPSPSRFPPNMVAGPNPAMYYNQPGPARGVSPGIPGPGFNSMGTMGRGIPHDKAPGGWIPPRNNGPPGKAPSRGEQNDYSQNFVDTGMRPQNFIRELELTSVVEDYPKLRELIQKKDEIVAKSSTPPMYYKCDLREFVLSSEFFGTKFDVILVDPPWEEYVHRAPGVADHMEYWTFEEIMNLKIEAIADTPSFIFLWVGDGIGLEQGRQCLKKWGFRRCEDICWVKTNKTNANPGLQHDAQTLFQHSKEHCLMGIKGTVRRSTDGHIIHANIDTDIIIAEEPPYGSTTKPEDMYRIIEHFSLGRRRLELFGEDHNIRSGWLTVGKGLSSSNFNAEAYIRNFADKDGKVWQGGGGRNPPPEAPHLVVTTPDIEGLRPKSPMQKNLQQQPSTSLPTTANSVNRRPAGNSPQNHTVLGPNQEVTGSNPSTPSQWAPPTGGLKMSDVLTIATDDKRFDAFNFNPSCGQTSGDHIEFDSHGGAVDFL